MKAIKKNYQYPVDSQVYSPTGEFRGNKAVNDMPYPMLPVYLELLEAGF